VSPHGSGGRRLIRKTADLIHRLPPGCLVSAVRMFKGLREALTLGMLRK
jgi:hypothetical protein